MGTQLPLPRKGHSIPSFQPMSIVAQWSPISATAEHLFYCPVALLVAKLTLQKYGRELQHQLQAGKLCRHETMECLKCFHMMLCGNKNTVISSCADAQWALRCPGNNFGWCPNNGWAPNILDLLPIWFLLPEIVILFIYSITS